MMNCSMPNPYPPIRVKKKNPRYAQILARSFAGQYSELTAVSNYIYQSIITSDEFRSAADTFECIAICEMRHFDMLGKLILLLGDEPRLRVRIPGNRSRYWSGSYTDYETEIVKMIRNDIRGEEDAIKDYRSAVNKIDDDWIVDVLERIILDEKHHINMLESLINNR